MQEHLTASHAEAATLVTRRELMDDRKANLFAGRDENGTVKAEIYIRKIFMERIDIRAARCHAELLLLRCVDVVAEVREIVEI